MENKEKTKKRADARNEDEVESKANKESLPSESEGQFEIIELFGTVFWARPTPKIYEMKRNTTVKKCDRLSERFCADIPRSFFRERHLKISTSSARDMKVFFISTIAMKKK